MPRLAYWDQDDYDKAMHLIKQPRDLLLALNFTANDKPLANKRVRVYVARSMVEGGDVFHEYLLDEEGCLEYTQHYADSLIDIELDAQSLPPQCGIDTLTYHWFHPGKWFTRLGIQRDLNGWDVKQLQAKDGDVTFEVHFDPSLTPNSAFVGFSNLLNYIFEEPKMGHTPEASVHLVGKGCAHFTFHMHAFFKKWMQNLSTPFQVGDKYPIELTLTVDAPFDIRSSNRKDPDFVPKSYAGRVDHADGNPYLGVPSTTPESTIQLHSTKSLTLYPEMITP